jgi:hypothetical protein
MAVFLLAGFFGTSCGYHFSGQGSRLPESVRTISIPLLLNNTNEPDLELTVTNVLVEKFRHDGRLEILSKSNADSTLYGSIEQYTIQPLAYFSGNVSGNSSSLNSINNNASQYRVKMKIKIRLEDKNGKSLLPERGVETQWEYNVGANIPATEIARQAAIYQASLYLGDKLIGLILEGF